MSSNPPSNPPKSKPVSSISGSKSAYPISGSTPVSVSAISSKF